ncbi:hypothetical protein B0H21DRAFT_820681 [Amylocystis lapponica]|nr:hypothetical protein B0H21DRAFT_820681 [Amylocystis lapponica]
MNLESLKEDILIDIISLLSPQDAHNLSSLSRLLHFVAMPRALSTIRLTRPSQTRAFCQYMLADVGNRLCWLQNLNVTKYALVHYDRPRQAYDPRVVGVPDSDAAALWLD